MLDPFADFLIGEHVHRPEVLHTAGVQHLHGECGEPALRNLRRALHVEHDAVARHLLLDALLSILHLCISPIARFYRFPPLTRAIPARSGHDCTSSRPPVLNISRTAPSWPMACSTSNQPRGSRCAGAASTISLMASRPSAPATSASRGS